MLLLLGCIIQQVPKEGTIAPELLKEDLNFLVKSIEEIHPNPYHSISKEEFYGQKLEVEEKLNRPMTQREFYKLIAPLVDSLKDGHTYVKPPLSETELDKIKVFPLNVSIFGDRIFVVENYENIKKGSEIFIN
ncbi:MAG: hypothetical protein MOIL_01668 [Candidatus Methanolliviera sp. GoM_oil]|nr:MAG: hypothetical protein MOIL_01668 [Candidatus Methanolliviera sp. GoM_oil]